MLLVPPLLCLLGVALGTVHTHPLAETKLPVVEKHGACPEPWLSFNGRCYTYVATRLSWADAELHCLSQGANLASIHSMEEHSFVRQLIKNFNPPEDPAWIGMSDFHKEGAWMWSDGSRVDFSLLYDGGPQRSADLYDCVHTNFGPKLWNDLPCYFTGPFVCASRTVCP